MARTATALKDLPLPSNDVAANNSRTSPSFRAPPAPGQPSPLRWNDIEALPIYAAVALFALFLWSIFANLTPTLHNSALKAVGIIGALALRHAWLKLDKDQHPAG